MTTQSVTQIPGYVAGTWTIDPDHSDVSFSVRHMMVSKVRGQFRSFSGEIVTAPDPTESTVTASLDVASIDTAKKERDDHLRSPDFFDAATWPTITYRSNKVRPDGDDFVVEGDLTIRGVTRPVELHLEVNGITPDPYGGTRAGFSATGQINRRDFGIDISLPMDGGGVVVGDKIQIALEIEAVLEQVDLTGVGS